MNNASKLLAAVTVSLAALGAAHADEQAAYPVGAQAATTAVAQSLAASAARTAIGEIAAYPGVAGGVAPSARTQAQEQPAHRAGSVRIDEGSYPTFAGRANARTL